jgi:hypothetical protein
MTNDTVIYEVLTPPQDPSLVAKAKAQPGGWIYDIDWNYPANQAVPPEAIRGGWEVNANGEFTGRFARNNRYRAVSRSPRSVKPYMRAAARTNRDQWIVEIDPRGEALFPDTPEALIRGWWYVNKNGVITDSFRPNALWKPENK